MVRPGGLTVEPPTGTINVIKGEVSFQRLLYGQMDLHEILVENVGEKNWWNCAGQLLFHLNNQSPVLALIMHVR